MKNIRLALRINAVFSACTGILLLLFSGFFAEYFSLSDNMPFWMLGLGLLGFAGFVFYHSRLSPLEAGWVRSISFMDIGWVVGSLVLVLFDPFAISGQGKLLLGLIAGCVAFFAFHQLYALGKGQASPRFESTGKS